MSRSAITHLFMHICSFPLVHRPKGVLMLVEKNSFTPFFGGFCKSTWYRRRRILAIRHSSDVVVSWISERLSFSSPTLSFSSVDCFYVPTFCIQEGLVLSCPLNRIILTSALRTLFGARLSLPSSFLSRICWWHSFSGVRYYTFSGFLTPVCS